MAKCCSSLGVLSRRCRCLRQNCRQSPVWDQSSHELAIARAANNPHCCLSGYVLLAPRSGRLPAQGQASLSLITGVKLPLLGITCKKARQSSKLQALGSPVVEPPIIVLIHEVLPVIGDVDAAAHASAVVKVVAGGLIDIAGRIIVRWRHIGLSALIRALCARLLSQLCKPHGLRSTFCHTVDNTCKGGWVRVFSTASLVTRTVS